MPSGIHDGRTKKKYYCIEEECHNEICMVTALYGNGRCRSCANRINNLGKKLSKKTKRKLSKLAKKRVGKLNSNFGNHKLAGENHPNFIDGRTLIQHYCKCGHTIDRSTARRNGQCSHCARIKENLRRWKDKDYREKVIRAMFRGLKLKPNKPEKRLKNLLNKLLPNEYKYVGDGKVILGGFCPDFINCNGQKKIIEFFGDYWHSRKDWKKRDKRKLKTYKNLGYDTLIIWESELKSFPEKTISRIMEFNDV